MKISRHSLISKIIQKQTGSAFFTLAVLVSGIFFAGCVKSPTFGQLPYSVLVNSYENTDEAELAAKRLASLKFKAFTVKRVNASGDFAIDLCVGVFKTQKQAQKTAAALKAKGLKQAEVIIYDKVRDDVEEFSKLPEKEKHNFTLKAAGAPDLPANIVDNLALLPYDPNFGIASLTAEDCRYNLGKITGRNMLAFDDELLPPGLVLEKIREQSLSLVLAVYEDTLFHYRIAILAAVLDTPAQVTGDWQKNQELGTVKQDKLDFRTTMGVCSGKLYARTIQQPGSDKEQQYSYLAFDAQNNYLLAFETADCPLEVLLSVIKTGAVKTGTTSAGWQDFPEIRRNFAILPVWDDMDLPAFSGLVLEKVTGGFAAERDNSVWAQSVTGNDRFRAFYVTDKDSFVVSVFNLNFSRTAENVFTVFIGDNKELNNGAPQPVFSGTGWYTDTPGFSELSFVHGSFIIALDYMSYLDWDHEFYHEIYRRFNAEKEMRLELLLHYAAKLPIWESMDMAADIPPADAPPANALPDDDF